METLCWATVNLPHAPRGSLLLIDLDDLGEHTSWLEAQIVVPVDPEVEADVPAELREGPTATPPETDEVGPDTNASDWQAELEAVHGLQPGDDLGA